MQIKTKYSLWDEVYIIDEDNIIFKAYIDEIDFSINTEDWGETLYDVKVERPVGLNRIDIEDELCLLEDEIFSSLTIAEKAVNNNKKIK